MSNFKRNPKLYLQTVKQILSNRQDIPSLPPLVGKLQGNIQSFTFEQLDSLIQQDPTLAAVILKTANGTLYKRPMPISSLKDAIATLGLGTVQSLVVAHQLKSLFQVRDAKLSAHLKERWHITQRLASAMKKMANLMDMDGDMAFLSAVLSDLGSSLIAQEFPRFQRDGDPPLFNWIADHYAHLISAHLLQFWGFDERIWLPIKKKGQWSFKSPAGFGFTELMNMCLVHLKHSDDTPELQDIPRFHEIPPAMRMLANERQFFLLKDY